MRESKIEGDVVAWAKARDILPIKMSPMGDGGWPDHLWLFYYPAICFIEFKAPGRKAKLRQALRIAELQRRGYPAEVFDNVADSIAFLEARLLSGPMEEASRKPDGAVP